MPALRGAPPGRGAPCEKDIDICDVAVPDGRMRAEGPRAAAGTDALVRAWTAPGAPDTAVRLRRELLALAETAVPDAATALALARRSMVPGAGADVGVLRRETGRSWSLSSPSAAPLRPSSFTSVPDWASCVGGRSASAHSDRCTADPLPPPIPISDALARSTTDRGTDGRAASVATGGGMSTRARPRTVRAPVRRSTMTAAKRTFASNGQLTGTAGVSGG